MSKISVLGSGMVGDVLAKGLASKGHEVMRGSREPAKLAPWPRVGTFAEAAAWGEIVVLAVKGAAAEAVLDLAGLENLAGKPVIDTTNPIEEGAPDAGVLRFFTGPGESLMERLQKKASGARFVKAFSCVGSAVMVDPKFEHGPPTMFVCGDDEAAKKVVTPILEALGWDVADMGVAAAARAIEPLCMLWCIPGFRENRWHHAFKLLRS